MNEITKVTRKGILLELMKVNLNIEEVIINFFSASDKPSSDGRYKNLQQDYHQHRINNADWDDDWFIEDNRLDFYGISDKNFLEFLCFIIHPENFKEENHIKDIVLLFNRKLIRDGFEIKPNGKKISGKLIFHGIQILGGTKSVYFYTDAYEGRKQYPYFLLQSNDWDDFHWRTSFNARFMHDEGANPISLGVVKILDDKNTEPHTYMVGDIEHLGRTHTLLPESFKQLSDNFCSVFDSDEGFRKLSDPELVQFKKTILRALNEASNSSKILKKFENLPGFVTSLLRDTEAYARIQNISETTLSFGIKNRNEDINFDFESSQLPFRANVLIGKNGCGKTTLLSNIAKEILEYNPENTLLSNRPSFSRVIQVSYSIFDNFSTPSDKENMKYIYCGLYDKNREINMVSLQKRLNLSLKNIKEKSKESIYAYLLADLLDIENIDFNSIENEYAKYSSGQKILITILAEIMTNIEENSLILFDEPETHLHPNMVFKLIRVLYRLLDDNNSYLIIATHSPIILQQVPSQYIHVMDINGNSKLNIECFGENFSVITKEIFSNYEINDISYKEIFRNLSDKMNEDQILDLFDGKLNLNARIYLKSIFKSKNIGEISIG